MTQRIPSLDGLRALSIAFVLLGHLGGTAGFPIPARAVSFFAIAELGVRVFFVISGFLITGLLFSEIERTGTISLPRFYLRRTLRILPPYYSMLLCIGLASTTGVIDLKPGDLLHAVTYTTNYHADRAWSLGHTWSLAVEEQFYVLWPAALLLLGPKRGLKIAVAIILLAPLVRLGEWYAGWRELIGNSFETVADALATGCVLAGARQALWRDARYRRLLTSRWFILVPLIPLALSALSRPRIDFAVATTVSNLCIAATIDWCVRFHQGRVGRILNAAPIAFVGVLSYSLYLWQQPFINRTSDAATARFPLSLLLAAACALVAYYAIERPSFAFRTRVEAARRRSAPFAPDPQRPATVSTTNGAQTPAFTPESAGTPANLAGGIVPPNELSTELPQ
jgi:peptidoglycan/LPS O-acetylase OafA/YrhL